MTLSVAQMLPAARAPQSPGTFGSLHVDSLRSSPHTPCTAARHGKSKPRVSDNPTTSFQRDTVRNTRNPVCVRNCLIAIVSRVTPAAVFYTNFSPAKGVNP
jgi:hypothetical protein